MNNNLSNSSDNDSNDLKGVSTDYNTDYMIDLLANSEKLKPEEHRVNFKSNKNLYTKMNKIKEDDIETENDYFTDKYNNNNNDFVNQNTFKEKHNEPKMKHKNDSINDFDKTDRYKTEENDDDENEEYDDYEKLSPYKKKQRKLTLLGELGDLANNQNIPLTKPYTINSDYYEMKYELEYHKKIIDKKNVVSWMSGVFLSSVEAIELLSSNYGHRYGININGWAERMDSERNNIYDILGSLYHKYNKQGSSISPELRLLFLLLSTLLGTQLSNTMETSNIKKTNNVSSNNIEEMRQKAKQDSYKNNDYLHQNIMKEHEDYKTLKDRFNFNDYEPNLKKMEEIKQKYMTENVMTENDDTENIKNHLQNLRSDINNSLDDEINNNKSISTSSNSLNNSNKNKSLYSKKSFKKGHGINII